MQGTKIGLLVGGMLLTAVGGNVQAETLQPDPAWQQGKLDNGFTWQLLTTPQRPGDRIELRLMVNTGSLSENTQQSGFAHFIPRLALTPEGGGTSAQFSALDVERMTEDGAHVLPPAVTSYAFTFYNLSLPNNRPERLKDALNGLSAMVGQLTIDDQRINAASASPDPVATFPANPQDPVWRYRLKGSTLLAHDPGQSVTPPFSREQLTQFYKTWYTPDAMTLYIVGHVDGRGVVEQIGQAFSSLKGKRADPAPLPALNPLPPQPVSLIDPTARQDTLSLVWDAPWHPIRDDRALTRYWHADLAREALFRRVQQALTKSPQKGDNLRFDCNVFYTRAQCAIRIDVPAGDSVTPAVTFLAQALAALKDDGLTQQEFDGLVARKTDELSRLFATYARTGTDVLMEQRLRSQQNGVVDIAPEQYQKLRQASLSGLTRDALNEALHQLLSQEATLMLIQRPGEPEAHMTDLQAAYQRIMTPEAESAAKPQDEAPGAQ